MRVRTHLVSMPWAPPESPSIQLGALKAHLTQALGPGADCRTYSAFFTILNDLRGPGLRRFHRRAAACGEYAYLPLFLRRFGPNPPRGHTVGRLVERLRRTPVAPLSLRALNELERATRRFLDQRLGPHLLVGGLNLVGFTLNYDQVYASLYAAEHLRRTFPGRRFLFMYGGCSASQPQAYGLLRELRVPGLVVVGEGERKLELLVRMLQALPWAEAEDALVTASQLDPGIVAIGQEIELGIPNPARHATQFGRLQELPLPDYHEYFGALRAACRDRRTYAAFRASTLVLLEGSRGCFHRCDFCGLNRTWHGFRTRTGRENLEAASALMRRYGTSRIEFVDSVCDAWAEDYAATALRAGIRQCSPMELRADHPQAFWTLLALAGTPSIQIGVETLSAPLLRAMNKGTTVVQNLVAHKCFAELGIGTTSNLIIWHPASTLADVRETRRILRHVPHWGPFWPVRFALMAGSVLYQRLTPEQRAGLRPARASRLPAGLARYALDESFEVPETLLPAPEVRRAWNAFAAEYQDAVFEHRNRPTRLEEVRVGPETVRVTDTRRGGIVLHELSGEVARVYDICHAGASAREIALCTGLSTSAVQAAIRRLERSRLLLRVDGCYVALALRQRDALVRDLLASGPIAAPPPVPTKRTR
ncbi:MAG TPA: radical SAM protein [Anaeromyxobacter sp.]|nr:radical SAM protein [Anaeromyxobacter sp.]